MKTYQIKSLLILFVALLLVSCTSKNKYTIDGSFIGTPTEDYIYMQKVFSDSLCLDSAKIIDGKFHFSGNIEQPTMYAFYCLRSEGVCMFILEPGKLTAKIDLNGWYNMGNAVLGEKYNNEFAAYSKEYNEKFTSEINLLNDQLATADENKKTKIQRDIDKLDNKQNAFDIQYIKTHPNSPVSLSILMYKPSVLSLDELGELLNTLSSLQEMGVYKNIKSYYDNQIALKNTTPYFNNKNSTPVYKELSLNDSSIIQSIINNNPGRALYIDSWGTCCGHCIAEFPQSNILYEKYSKDIEFIYLCDNGNEKEWKNLIEKYQLSGQHYLLNDKLSKTFFSEIGMNYISNPHYVLVNKNGKIVNSNAPRPSMEEIELALQKLIE